MQRAPGMWPATGSIGSTSPRKRASARASTRSIDPRRSITSSTIETTRVNAARIGNVVGAPCLDVAAQRISCGLPGGEAAVQHGHGGVTEPAKQPPGPRCVGAVAGVVGDHLRVRIDPPATERFGQRARVRQRVPTRDARRSAARTGPSRDPQRGRRDVSGRVGRGARRRIGERSAAVDHAPGRIFVMFE